MSLHNEHDGALRLEERQAVLAEIVKVLQLDSESLSENQCYLLEIDSSLLTTEHAEKQGPTAFLSRRQPLRRAAVL